MIALLGYDARQAMTEPTPCDSCGQAEQILSALQEQLRAMLDRKRTTSSALLLAADEADEAEVHDDEPQPQAQAQAQAQQP